MLPYFFPSAIPPSKEIVILISQSFSTNVEDIIINAGGSHFHQLSWTLRLKISLGAARGLAFLHNSETKVIYRDFKTSNILLDTVCTEKLVMSLYCLI